MKEKYFYEVMFDDTSIDVSKEVGLVWSIANSLRGAYTSDKYKDVIISMVVIRRFECALEATKDMVVAKHKQNPNLPAALLCQDSKYPFYNYSEYNLKRLLDDSDNIAENLKSYIESFSANIQLILEKLLKFSTQIEKMDKSNRLYSVVRKFSDLDLYPEHVDSIKMGYIFEDIIRRFSENAEAGDHYTPREVIRLMANILLAEGCDDLLTEEGKIATVLDAACGSGGMLSTTYDFLRRKNPYVDVRLFGQEINPESYAICLADMLIKGQDIKNIKGEEEANTLTTDCFPDQKMRLVVMNPPFGKEWGGKDAPDGQEKAVRAEFKKGGRFEHGLPGIEEGFILDVLQNYVTYKTYFELNKTIEDDPELETIAAKRKIAKYIELHDTNIAQKVEIIIEHFRNNIMKELGGKAKAMVITSSRQAAVKYRNEFEAYISKHGYTGIRALVAFSGKVSLDGHEYTEAVMNGIREEDLPEAFDSNSYQVLLVANKYQTGFDQPKLCAMYVDKCLRGVNAVQTLSRLNRICAPYDKKTFVLDFKNEYEDIQSSFAPFYTETILNETITPSDIRAVEAQVDQYNFLDIDDIEEFNGYLYQEKRTSKEKARMWALLDKSLQLINRHSELEKLEIRSTIKRFLRFYSFLIQATCFESVDLHKKYNFLSYLVKEIEVGHGGNDFDIADKITASNFRQKKTGEKTHEIESNPEVNLPTPNEVFMDEAVKKKLSEIIDEINAAYNKNFDVDVATKSALQMRDILLKNGHLRDSARNNSLKDFRFAYFDAVQDALIAGYEQNQDFFALLLDNDEKKRELMQVFLEDIYKKLRES